MSDAAGFERTLWPGKEPVLIALAAASAGFASLGASDLIALTDDASPAQPGNLQTAIPVPAFGAAAEKTETAPAPAREEFSQTPAAPVVMPAPVAQAGEVDPAPVDPALAEPAPVQAMQVEAAPVEVPVALPPAVAVTPDQPLPAPARETVDAAFAEFRIPDSPAAPLAMAEPAPEALAAPTSMPEPAAPALAAAPPVFDGPPLILASIEAGSAALPAPIQSLPDIALPEIALPEIALPEIEAPAAALAAGPEQAPAPLAAPVPEAPAAVLAASEAAAPALPHAALAEAPGNQADDTAALAEWTRSVRQVGGWSLAQAADTSAADAPTAQAGNAPSPAFRDAPLAARKHRLTGRGIEFALPVVMEGRAPAWVPLLIDAEQNVCVRIADLLALIQPMLPPETFSRLSAAKGAQEFVSLRELRLQGIDFRYDAPRNRLVLGEVASASRAPRMALRGQ